MGGQERVEEGEMPKERPQGLKERIEKKGSLEGRKRSK